MLDPPQERTALSKLYVVAKQILAKEIAKSPIDAAGRVDVLLLVEIFDYLDNSLVGEIHK